jgi:HlyD family secretion protein
VKKRISISLGVLVIIVLLGVFIKSKRSDKKEELFTSVQKGKFEVSVSVSGELLAEHSENIMGPMELRSPLLGYMQVKIQDLIAEGTVVDSGQYVATLDRTEASNKLKDIEDEIQKVESQFIRTQLDSTINLREARTNILNLKFAIEEKEIVAEQSKFEAPAIIRQSQIELDKSKRALEQAIQNYKLKIEQFIASMKEVSVNLSQIKRKRNAMQTLLNKFVIYAPKSGMVIYSKDWNGQKRKVGSIISPWELQVATLPDMSSMLSKTYINEIDISKIKSGQNVSISLDAFPEKQYTGKVLEVANVGEQLPGTDAKVFEVTIKVNESDPIMRPGMTTSNTITIKEFSNVLSIPLEALHTMDSLTFVYNKKGYKQLVLTGLSNDNSIIIEKGLKEKDELFLSVPNDAKDLEFNDTVLKLEILNKFKLSRTLQLDEKKTVAPDNTPSLSSNNKIKYRRV